MTAITQSDFGGMTPVKDDHLLGPSSAVLAQNCWLYTGALKGMPQLTPLYTCVHPSTAKVFRIPKQYNDAPHLPDSWWLEFPSAYAEVIHSPVLEDTYDRYYWAGPGVPPQYNAFADLALGTGAAPGLILGVPEPTSAPVLAAAGGTGPMVSRAYIVTWVSGFGEEGPPSSAVLVSGNQDAVWNLTLPSYDVALFPNRNLTLANIYRTVTSSAGTADYHLVAQVPIGTVAYADMILDSVVSGKSICPSMTWTAPPTDLQGWIAMPNGIIAGWRNQQEIWFCEPYRPHAWPAGYVVAVDAPIVGFGVIDQNLVVCTQEGPYIITGTAPANMTSSKIAIKEPCMSRGSIVSTLVTNAMGVTLSGVLYASPNGLILVASGIIKNLTEQFLSKDAWNLYLPVSTLCAARIGPNYMAYGGTQLGVFNADAFNTDDSAGAGLGAFETTDYTGARQGAFINPLDPHIALTLLTQPPSSPVINIWNDVWSGEVFVLQGSTVSWLNLSTSTPTPQTYIWKSRIFETEYQRNLEAGKVFFSVPSTVAVQPNPRVTDQTELLTWQPGQWAIFRLYADRGDGVMTLVYQQELRASGEVIRPPCGFKADYWQYEIEGVVNVNRVQLATSMKDLRLAK